jgi:hypothetical protein
MTFGASIQALNRSKFLEMTIRRHSMTVDTPNANAVQFFNAAKKSATQAGMPRAIRTYRDATALRLAESPPAGIFQLTFERPVSREKSICAWRSHHAESYLFLSLGLM